MSGENNLITWQRMALPALLRAAGAALPPATAGVTALTHHIYRDPALFDASFDQVKCAFLMTRLTCGAVPCVLVVNRLTPEVESFCGRWDITIDYDASLPGGIPCLSRDYIERLHERFETEYVLAIHGDGFALRSGLEAFVGPYDYIGAPWRPSSWYTRLAFPHPRFSVGNGGFSLRSRRLCERASWYFRRKYRLIPYCYALVDDVFYCRVLPRFEPAVRRIMTYAPPEVAGRFSFEAYDAYYPRDGEMPLGLHTVNGFNRVSRDFSGRVAAWLGETGACAPRPAGRG